VGVVAGDEAQVSDGRQPAGLALLRAAVAAVEKTAVEPVWALSDAEIAEAMALVGRLRAGGGRTEVATVTEAVDRGLPTEHGWGTVDWVVRAESAAAPGPSVAHAASVARVATAASRRRPASGEPGRELDAATAGLVDGALSLGQADQLLRFVAEVGRVADPEAVEADLAVLVENAGSLSERELATAIRYAARLLKPSARLEREEDVLRQARSLVKRPGPAGLAEYRLVLGPEGSAVVDSAVAALCAPVPGPDGEPDLRPASLRRADALVSLVARAVASAGEVATTDRAQVVVTISLDRLTQELDARGGGVTGTGEVLSPVTVRRMACDAGIVPMVLGSRGEVLELGRAVRLFTRGQRRLLWQRDGGCTYPGCTMPQAWTEAHHVRHWAHGGPTDVSNAALLCQRHHTVVHGRGLTATVTDTRVTWHL
jgi:hypothetical protein